jgi:hypothetical protein
MDSELAKASRIWGCAGIVTVNGICETLIEGATAAAVTLDVQHTANVQQAEVSAYPKRPRVVFDMSLCIVKFLATWG